MSGESLEGRNGHLHTHTPLDLVLLEDDWIGPDPRYLLSIVLALLASGVTMAARYQRYVQSPKSGKRPVNLLRAWGVPLSHIKRAMREIERKAFHLCGLLVPLCHLLLLRNGWSNLACVKLCWAITLVGCTADVARLNVPLVRRHWPLQSIMREHETKELTGGCYFSLGCTLSISLSPPSIAMASILFLVLGDMSAALIGVSFGGEVAHVKLGRKGKKSLEGSVAMFLVCFCLGCVFFAAVPLREYAVFLAALTATLTELYEPFRLNDNLTIPIFAALALQIGLQRVRCPPCAS
mmetsp:Transcript_9983/g.32084  ORF Transcript_9983/g.32084 Transcript_9983/m.32084 type:complete len:294 (-) Transcript_9983:344-1225(-)